MQRQIIGCGIELGNRVYLLHAVALEHGCIGNERIECDDVHAQSLALDADQTADIAVGVDRQRLALQLRTRTGSKAVAGHVDHHAQSQLGNGIRILTRSVHHDDTACRSRCKVDIIVTGTGTNDDFELLGGVDDLGRDLVAADDDRIGIGDSLQQLRLVRILLQQRERMTRALYDFANTVDSLLCEGLLGSYQNFHLFQ